MKHLFIVNPTAGGKDSTSEVRAKVEEAFSTREGQYEIYVTRAPLDATEKIKSEASTGEHIRAYACGGDGTLNEVVTGAADYENLSVTCMPMGSGNDFIKQFPNPQAFYQPESFRTVTEKRLDLMAAAGCVAVNVCSVGFDARIGTQIDRYRRLPLLSGPRAYLASVAVNLIRGVVKPCRVEMPGIPPVDEQK